jgi:predicted dehydrogenase
MPQPSAEKERLMDRVRIGVIGVGGMGSSHARQILEGQVPRAQLAAVCDPLAAHRRKFPGVRRFSDSGVMIRSGAIDAVVVATPHYSHTTIGIDALRHGLHVLVEKPISVHKADAERLVAAHRGRDRVFAAMFNMRTMPVYRKLKELLDRGEFGTVQRFLWIVTDWFRPQAYFDSGAWRGTWAGEGGGVLLNQCPHQFDQIQWLFGMPRRIYGFCRFGARHRIEVEDEATAVMEYAGGLTGVFIAATGEAPGTNRLEIAADRGRIVVEDNRRLEFLRNEVSASEFIRTSQALWDKPPFKKERIAAPGKAASHLVILRNFVDAILDGAPLIAPAQEGVNSVELANAVVFSAVTGKPVALPLNGKAYAALLRKLIAQRRRG